MYNRFLKHKNKRNKIIGHSHRIALHLPIVRMNANGINGFPINTVDCLYYCTSERKSIDPQSIKRNGPTLSS
ncbi:hypothetical protein BLOT_010283 [Blomia tropicalis]|nr:hypothetical protein BLOT_010283 [Blomia tropicalis]